MTAAISESECSIDSLCVNTIRTLAIDAIEKASSGHPGAPMGLAPAAYVLWTRFLKHNPRNPDWMNRDRFVLSGGHASMLLYSLLFLTGYDLSLEDIQDFRQWHSKTPGHPEYGVTPGVETTTGPLGQGFANAVGMAMAERHLAAVYNRPAYEVIDHHTYVMCGDGDLMEGITAEAASLAGHLGLGRLIAVYDDNRITIEGSTDISFTEDVAMRFQAHGWQVIRVEDGNDFDALTEAFAEAKSQKDKPSLVMVRTQIAYGSPSKQGTAAAHGAPLGKEEVCLTKRNLGCPEDVDFCVPDEPLNLLRECVPRGQAAEHAWREQFNAYTGAHPELSQQLLAAIDGRVPAGWDAALPRFDNGEGPIATRVASGKALNAIASRLPALIGGSADLAPSNKTLIDTSHDYQKNSYDGRNIRFGVREHAMGAILSGMALHKGVRPYGGTFLVFADYMRPSIRLAALMKLPVIYIFTHDSVAVGEDGPTHQPIEHLASLRAIPDLTVIRPADANETSQAWRQAVETADGPVALILSRQKLPVLETTSDSATGSLSQGAYVLSDADETADILLLATGSEVHLILAAQDLLRKQGVKARVISMPSWELFERQSQGYRDSVLPPALSARLAVEAGLPIGWERYVGRQGAVLGIRNFGTSAPGSVVLKNLGFTPENVVQKTLELLNR